jgi:hypothetical protein
MWRRVICLLLFTLKIKVEYSSETSVNTYQNCMVSGPKRQNRTYVSASDKNNIKYYKHAVHHINAASTEMYVQKGDPKTI